MFYQSNERHCNEITSSRRSILILGDGSYSRLLLIIAELLILLILVVQGLYTSLRVRASLTLIGATLTLVLRLLYRLLLQQLLLQLLLLLLRRIHAMRHVRLVRMVYDLVGDDVVRRLRLESQQFAQVIGQISRILRLWLYRRLGYPAILRLLMLLLSLTFVSGVAA